MMADPPVEDGGVQLTVTRSCPAVALTAVGAEGAPTGVAVKLLDSAPAPPALTARTFTS